MSYIDKIRKLYYISHNNIDNNLGFSKAEINAAEKDLDIKFPLELKNYYLTLGKVEEINYSYNRLLKPNEEIKFSDDRFLIFYEENQCVAQWGIKEEDLKKDNPPVWANYGTNKNANWYKETNSTDDFFLLMSVYNGTFGGLKYNANYLGHVKQKFVTYIDTNWVIEESISYDKQKIYTDNFNEVISLSFDEQNNCTCIFIGSSCKEKFENLLNKIQIEWSYISYEDNEYL